MIKKFIKNNYLSFEEGNRNSSIVTLIGFSLHLGLDIKTLEKELKEEISVDNFILDEINRLWGYCNFKRYGDYWKNEKAKEVFDF